MPIQHSNDRILKAMRRWTTKADIQETIQKLRERVPNMTIRTTLMVGFPGETESEFEELLQFVRENPIEHLGVFAFSREEGAAASKLPDHLPEDIKAQRKNKLERLQEGLVRARSNRTLGRNVRIIIDGSRTDGTFVGRHQGQCADVDNVVVVTKVVGDDITVQKGMFYQARIVAMRRDGNIDVEIIGKDDGPGIV